MATSRAGAARVTGGRTVSAFGLAVVLALLSLILSACAESRVHFTFEEDGSYRVEGTVVLTRPDERALLRLDELRERLELVGLTTDDLAEPGRLGFTFQGDSTHDVWARQQAGGGPRLWTDQGLLRKKFVFFWPLDWDVYVEGVAPDGLDEPEVVSFRTSDLQVTASFPGSGARYNGTLEAGSDGRTVTWAVAPLEPASMRAEYSSSVWWRVALVPVFVVAIVVLLLVWRYRSLQNVPRVGDAVSPAPTASISCPVCAAPMTPGKLCARCVATADSADDT
ncbi:MAG: hypothetical protein ACYCX3_05840 [Thermoleophilia bacterium]